MPKKEVVEKKALPQEKATKTIKKSSYSKKKKK